MEPASRGLHDALLSGLNRNGTVLRMGSGRSRGFDHKPAIETLSSPQLFPADLVTHRAGHAIFSRSGFLSVSLKRQKGKDLGLAALPFCLIVRHGHVASGADVFNVGARFRMVDRFSPYATLPIWVARRIRHHTGTPVESNGDIFS